MAKSAATTAARTPVEKGSFDIPHVKYVLSNGLEVIMHRDVSLPMVSVNLWYHAGPVNERRGQSGFAHLFEHLMFEGSKHAGNQFDYLLESIGGTNMNGTTSWDRTNYYETVPAEHLELALWLEADRMGYMIDALTQERLDVQREVVKNERRQSYENQPYGPSSLAMYDALFPEGHPYHGAIIGSMKDLSDATLQDVAKFFSQYYAPGNATLVIAGHFDEQTARQFVTKHFATLPARAAPARPTTGDSATTPLPGPKLPARVDVREDVQLPQVAFAWLVPPAFSTDEPALELATRILGSGKSSRLYQALVASGLSNGASASLDANQVTSILTIQARAASGHTNAELETTITTELARLAAAGPTGDELARAKTSLILELASQLQRLNAHGGEGGRAGWLQRLNRYLNDPGALPSWVQKHKDVTSAQVAEVIANHLHMDRAVIVTTTAQASVPPPPPPTPRTAGAN
jgi:zinc protease